MHLRSSSSIGAQASRSRSLSVRVHAAQADSKRVLITGGNTGIGFETAKSLCGKGYEVVIACRDQQRASDAISKLKQGQPSAQLSFVPCDLGNLASVKDCASRLLDDGRPFDVILNNAGVMATPQMQTKDGFEFQLGVNHLGHYTLTNLLLPSVLAANKPTRIINVASAAHVMGSVNFDDLFRQKPGAYQPWEAYGQSKLANIMFSYELAKKLQAHPNITVNCLHPGVVRTELGRYMVDDTNKWFMAPMVALAFLFFKSPEQGAETSIHLASSPEVEGLSSKYWVDKKPINSSPASYDAQMASKLWQVSSELTGVDAFSSVPVSV